MGYDDDDDLALLSGMRVESLWVTEDESALYLETPSRWLQWVTEADCCSETWFADITGVDQLIGHTVVAAAYIDMPVDSVADGRSRQEFDEFYGVRITTEAGDTDIVYRNSSNGYYGGYATLAVANPPTLDGCRQITTDWSA